MIDAIYHRTYNNYYPLFRGHFLICQTCSYDMDAFAEYPDLVFNSGVTCVLKHARLRLTHHTPVPCHAAMLRAKSNNVANCKWELIAFALYLQPQ